MTNEHEKRAIYEVMLWDSMLTEPPLKDGTHTNIRSLKTLIDVVARMQDEAHAAGRAEVIAEVLPVLEFYANEDFHFDDKWSSGTKLTDSTIENDRGQRARELLQKLKETK